VNAIDALNTGGKRKRTHTAQSVFKLPAEAKALAIQEAEIHGVSEGHIYRTALAEYFERRGITA